MEPVLPDYAEVFADVFMAVSVSASLLFFLAWFVVAAFRFVRGMM